MDYMKKPLINATPVTKIIGEQYDELQNLINNTKDYWSGWFENKPEGKIQVSLRKQVPMNIEKEMYLFQRMEITQYQRIDIKIDDEDKIKKTSKELLKKLLEDIGIERFMDEDGCNGIFTKRVESEYSIEDSAYCYVNPFIPEGYWENHSLETGYVEII